MTPPQMEKKFRSYVPEKTDMREFTFRAVLIGLVLTAILGAANAYLGLKAGMTIAATYPAAVIGMALLKLMKGSLLEENIARTIGSIGESVAAGAIFTIPAFVLSGLWPGLTADKYWNSVALMVIGGTLGILFVTLLRRVMVEDPDLPFPESVAASEIHKAGQQGSKAAKILFANMGFGGFMYLLGAVNVFNPSNTIPRQHRRCGQAVAAAHQHESQRSHHHHGRRIAVHRARREPRLSGRRLHHRSAARRAELCRRRAGLGIAGSAPHLRPGALPAGGPTGGAADLVDPAGAIGLFLHRAAHRRGRHAGGRFLHPVPHAQATGRRDVSRGIRSEKIGRIACRHQPHRARSERPRRVSPAWVSCSLAMVGLYYYFISAGKPVQFDSAHGRHSRRRWSWWCSGFFFAAVSGNLVGMIGSSNNPVSGLTLCTLVIAALLMVALGVSGASGVAAVLGVSAVVCVSSAVAGEMLQDLKVGHILGGTPAKMQIGDMLGVVVASLVLFFPLAILDKAYHFGSSKLPAPQAGLMAMLSKGIVGGDMAWPLVVVGILMGFALIMVEVKSPMLFSVGCICRWAPPSPSSSAD